MPGIELPAYQSQPRVSAGGGAFVETQATPDASIVGGQGQGQGKRSMFNYSNLGATQKTLCDSLLTAIHQGNVALVNSELSSSKYTNDDLQKVLSTELKKGGFTFLAYSADRQIKIGIESRKAIIESIWNKASTNVRDLWIGVSYNIISYLKNQQQQNQGDKEIYNDIIQKIQDYQNGRSVGAGTPFHEVGRPTLPLQSGRGAGSSPRRGRYERSTTKDI